MEKQLSARAQMGPKLLRGSAGPGGGCQSEAAPSLPLELKKCMKNNLSHTQTYLTHRDVLYWDPEHNNDRTSQKRQIARGLSWLYSPCLFTVKRKDAGEQGAKWRFLDDARILLLLAPTGLICLSGRLISPSQGFFIKYKGLQRLPGSTGQA